MASRHNQQRSSPRGHGHGVLSHQYYHMTNAQGLLNGSNTSESFMGQHGFNEERTVDPRNLTLDQVAPGGSGNTQDFGSLSGNQFQPGFDAGAHPESYFTGYDYISSSYLNSSQVDSGEEA